MDILAAEVIIHVYLFLKRRETDREMRGEGWEYVWSSWPI